MLEKTVEFAILRVIAGNATAESPEFVAWGRDIAKSFGDVDGKDPASIRVKIMKIDSVLGAEFLMLITWPF